MTTRQELLDQWQQRLADAEQACEAAVVPAWSDRLRVRLYRFLLAMYRETDWPGKKDDVDNIQGRAAYLQLAVAERKDEFAGKEPRTRAEILQGLRNVKGLSDELAPAGPLTDGLQPTSPFVVAGCRKRVDAERISRQLRRHGLKPVIGNNGGLFQVFVTAENAPAALAIVQRLENSRPVAAPRQIHSPPVRKVQHHPLETLSFCCTLLFGIAAIFFMLGFLIGVCFGTNRDSMHYGQEDVTNAAGAAIFCTLAAVVFGFIWMQLKQRYSGDANR